MSAAELILYMYMHCYAIFIRYSLPVNFQAVIMKPHRKQQSKLTQILTSLYGHLDSNYIASEAEVGLLMLLLYVTILYTTHTIFYSWSICLVSLLDSKIITLMCSSR